MMQITTPICRFEDFIQELQSVPASEVSRRLLLMKSNYCHWQLLNFSSLYSLDSKAMIDTARQIIELASVHFFEVLKARFFTESSHSTLFDRRYVSSSGKEVMSEELRRLYALTQRVVERLADLYGIHPQDVAEHVESLTAQNLQGFAERLQEEAESVPAFYLGNSFLHGDYAALNEREAPLEDYIGLFDRVARKEEGPYLPLVKQEGVDIKETMTMEYVATEMTYRLAQLPNEEVIGRKFNLFITDKGTLTYRVEEVIDLWEQLIAYKLCPESDSEAPNILAFRGTQRLTHLPGFWGSMIAIWHPNGPGGNVVRTKKVFEIEDMISSSGRKWIFTGHSMGTKIAAAFAKREKLRESVAFVHSFGSPGRDKDHSTPGTQALKAAHIGSLHDPVFQLGGAREGPTYVLVTERESGRPQAVFEMIHRVVDAVLQHHSRAQLVANESWILSKIPQGRPIARYSPIWGFTHRFLSHHLYGPLKMVVLVLRAVWPLFAKLGRGIYRTAKKIMPKLGLDSLPPFILVSKNLGMTSATAPSGS